MPSFPTSASKANCDASTDDPKLAILTDLATLIDKFNDLLLTVQPLDAELSTLALMNTTRVAEIAALSAFIGGLLDDADAPTALATLGALLNATVALTGATTVTTLHRGKLLDCTNTWTLSFTAAATMGVCAFAYRNSGSGTITLDPSGGELIDGVATLAIGPGESGFVLCDGAAFKTACKITNPGFGEAVTSPTRAFNTNYTNTDSRPRYIAVVGGYGSGATMTLVLDGVTVCRGYASGSAEALITYEIPVGSVYSVTATVMVLTTWTERLN
jgi:hypothetical protein